MRTEILVLGIVTNEVCAFSCLLRHARKDILLRAPFREIQSGGLVHERKNGVHDLDKAVYARIEIHLINNDLAWITRWGGMPEGIT